MTRELLFSMRKVILDGMRKVILDVDIYPWKWLNMSWHMFHLNFMQILKLNFSSNDVHKGVRMSSPLIKAEKKSNSAKLVQASTFEVNSSNLLPSHNTPDCALAKPVKVAKNPRMVMTTWGFILEWVGEKEKLGLFIPGFKMRHYSLLLCANWAVGISPCIFLMRRTISRVFCLMRLDSG